MSPKDRGDEEEKGEEQFQVEAAIPSIAVTAPAAKRRESPGRRGRNDQPRFAEHDGEQNGVDGRAVLLRQIREMFVQVRDDADEKADELHTLRLTLSCGGVATEQRCVQSRKGDEPVAAKFRRDSSRVSLLNSGFPVPGNVAVPGIVGSSVNPSGVRRDGATIPLWSGIGFMSSTNSSSMRITMAVTLSSPPRSLAR